MPELMAIVTDRPRPKPRVSLGLSSNRSISPSHPLYQNLLYISGVNGSKLHESSLDQNLVKPKARRRSLLDPPISSLSKCDENATDNVNRNITIERKISIKIDEDKSKKNIISDSNDKSSDFQPIKCMPYNSPRLTKAKTCRECCNLTMQRPREVKSSALPRAVATNKTSSNSTDSLNKKLQSGLSSKNIPSRSERGAVSTFTQLRKQSFKKIEEVSTTKDIDPKSSDFRKRIGSGAKDADKRKSAAIPPQMVANLANKFNAMISENHKIPGTVAESGRKRINSKGSSLPIVQSCPSSPLRNNLTLKNRRDTNTKDSIVPNISSTNIKTTTNIKKDEINKKFQKQTSLPTRASPPPKTSSPKSVSPKPPSSTSSSPKASSPNTRRKNFVQQAIMNYEVSLSTSSSPEVKRRNSLPKRTVSTLADEKSRVDTFASPVLLRRLLQSAADVKASKFTSECNHRDTRINQRFNQQEMPKKGGGQSEGRIATISQNSAPGRVGRVLQTTTTTSKDSIESNVGTKNEMNTSPIKISCVNQLGSSKCAQNKLFSTTVFCSEPDDKNDEKVIGVSALARGRELYDKRVSAAANESEIENNGGDNKIIKRIPPPLPTTQPRQINAGVNMKRNGNNKTAVKSDVKVQTVNNGKSSFLHSATIDNYSDKTNQLDTITKFEKSDLKSEISNFKSSFLHSMNVKETESKTCESITASIEKKLIIEKTNYVPNTSFLWRQRQCVTVTTTSTGSVIPPPPNSAPPPIPELNEELKECDNIYDDVVSPCTDEFYDEPLYTEAHVSPQNDLRRNSSDLITNNDSDEGWVDVSDTEMEGNGHKEIISLPVNTRVKNMSRKNVQKRNSVSRRMSWHQDDTKHDSSKVPMNSAPEDYAEFDDDFSGSDESNSTNPDHHYEAVYKLIQDKYKSAPKHDQDANGESILEESPGEIEDKEFTNRNSLVSEANAIVDKKEKRLKRNWSLTKSDIRLEFTSRLNKIRIKKTSTSATDVHSVQGAAEIKKTKPWSLKTKFSRKSSDPTSPTKKSPSPKKESALFYVPNCISSNETETSDESTRNTISIVSMQTGRRSSRSNVVRPREAPPAPPIQATKPRTDSFSSVESSKRTSISSDWELVQENDNYSRFSGSINSGRNIESDLESMISGMHCNDGESKIRPTVTVSRSSSTVSSESDLPINLIASSKIRSSVASSHSSSSSDSYRQNDVNEMSLVQQMQLLFQEASERHTLRSVKSVTSMGSGTNISSSEYEENSECFLRRSHTVLSAFDDEPLYQFYNIDAQKRATQMQLLEDSDDEIYEAIYEVQKNPVLRSETAAMDLLGSGGTSQRSLWGELKEVRNSGLLDKITPQQRGLQEAMFEVITSEASYLKSLNVLTHHFMNCPQFKDSTLPDCILTQPEWKILFSDVPAVKDVSEKLLADLEKRWQENVVMQEVCDILYDHANKNFGVFIKYCSNQIHQDRTLKQLKEKKPQFVEVLKKLESSPKCQSLAMHSFLMLPMQRITRLPLLIDAILNRLKEGTKEYASCQSALKKLNSIAQECNEGAHKIIRMEEMFAIAQTLNFKDIKNLPIVSASRWLVKRGPLERLTLKQYSSKLGLSTKRMAKQTVHVFLFTDCLMITKKKGEESYHVLDHCPRNMVQISDFNTDQLPARCPESCKFLFKLTLLQNCENKTVEMIMSSAEHERARWIEAVTPKISENPDEKIYDTWDCPQVQAIHPYIAQESDELTLEVSDVINVNKKLADGWFFGERLRDGAQGWFPGNYTNEIVSEHVRARNLRQRYRLMEVLSQVST